MIEKTTTYTSKVISLSITELRMMLGILERDGEITGVSFYVSAEPPRIEFSLRKAEMHEIIDEVWGQKR